MTEVLFMGRKEVSANLLKYVNSLPDVVIKGVLTDNHLIGSPTVAIAHELNLPVYSFDEALLLMKNGKLTFDLGLSILYWRKLVDEFLSIPSKGIINFHPAILPEYKGVAGYNLAILEGLNEWGVSAHYVDKSIDTGEIISVEKFNIDNNSETVVSLERKSMKVLERVAINVINDAIKNESKLSSSPNIGGKYVTRSEMESMKLVIDGDNVERKVRAFWFPPYDGAYIEIDGNKYTLVSKDILNTLSPEGCTSLFTNESKDV